MNQNRIWLAIVELAMDLTAWMQQLAMTGTKARTWEPKRLRLRLFRSWAASPAAPGRSTYDYPQTHPGPI